MSTPEDVTTRIQRWFEGVKLASLELPDGWFGRPHDNLHQLTWAAATKHKVLLELDDQILVILTDPGKVETLPKQLRFHDCLQVTLDWQEYGNMKPRIDGHGPGTVTLHA